MSGLIAMLMTAAVAVWTALAALVPAPCRPVARVRVARMCDSAATTPFDADVGKLLSLLIDSVYTDRVRAPATAPRPTRSRRTARATAK